MSVIQYVLFLVLVGLATFCQNLTGFAFGLIFVGVAGATHLMSIADAANVACLLSVVNGVTYLRAHRQVPQWTLLKPMLVSSVIGVIAGVLLLLGLAIVACALLLLLQKQVNAQMSGPVSLWVAGVASGLLGGLFATPGPPMVYHLYRQPLDRLVVRQCLFSMFLTCALLRLVMVAWEGGITASVLLAAALAFPVVTVVTWLHMRHPPALPKRLVEWMVCLLLVLSGASLLVSGWNASHPQPVVPDDEMAMAAPQRSPAAAPAPR
jgi:uncharacterized membrane protein YfcA